MSLPQASSGFRNSEETEKHPHGIAVATEDLDTGAALVAGISGDLDPVEVARVRCVALDFFHSRLTSNHWRDRRKIDLGILPMMCS
jgi:ACS family allantoate permease-like MFS transporter